MVFGLYEPVQAKKIITDLHLHSTASDGLLSPDDLVKGVKKAGVNVMALTDHETLAGLEMAEKAAAQHDIFFIPGIEINTGGEDEIHLLVYFVHDKMKELTELLKAISKDRQNRGSRFVSRFNELGIKLALEDLRISPGTDCNRLHFARALVSKGFVRSVAEAFDRYLAVGRPAYIPRLRLETCEVIKLARGLGTVPILAHPELIRKQPLKSLEAIRQLKEAGLMGIEAYHSKHSPTACKHWDHLARSLDLLVTGGSDFHEHQDDHGEIGSQSARWTFMQKDTERFLYHSKMTR